MINEKSTSEPTTVPGGSDAQTVVMPGLADAAAAAVDRWTAGERRAEPGEVCTCGRPAVKVFIGGKFGDTGYCGLPDGGLPGPCPFCEGPRHEQRCPQYQLRPVPPSDQAAPAGVEMESVEEYEQRRAKEELQPQPAAASEDDVVDEPVRMRAADLSRHDLVATGDPDDPGMEVKHVEPAESGDHVGVLFAGPFYRTYGVDELVELVDPEVVEAARRAAEQRARRALMIEGLQRLARMAEADPDFPLPDFHLELSGSLASPAQVDAFAAAMGVTVERRYSRAHAEWTHGDNGFGTGLTVHFHAGDPSAPAGDPIVPAAAASEPSTGGVR